MAISLKAITSSACILADGGWGTEFQKLGLEPGTSPEHWNLLYPDRVAQVARSYVDAGAQIILTNTFGGNRLSLARQGLEDRLFEVNRRGAEISKEAVGDRALVFGSMGPTGTLPQKAMIGGADLYTSYSVQAEALWRGGVDALLIETMIDMDEMNIAARAARENTPLQFVISMTFHSGERMTPAGTCVTPEEAVAEMERSGGWIVGANCGIGPQHYVAVCERMRAVTSKPIWIKANAGLPQIRGTEIVYTQGPDVFGSFALQLRNAGANVIGGCCGTGPAHIRHLRELFGH